MGERVIAIRPERINCKTPNWFSPSKSACVSSLCPDFSMTVYSLVISKIRALWLRTIFFDLIALHQCLGWYFVEGNLLKYHLFIGVVKAFSTSINFSICLTMLTTFSFSSLITMVNLEIPAIADSETVRLNIHLLRVKMMVILLSKPIWFSVYAVMIYSCLIISIVSECITIRLHQADTWILFLRPGPLGKYCPPVRS